MITPGDQIFDMGAIIRRHNVLNGLRFSLLEFGLIALLVGRFSARRSAHAA